MSYDDSLQEAALVFARCRDRYTSQQAWDQCTWDHMMLGTSKIRPVDNPAWFMSIYKRALSNEFHYYAEHCRLQREAQGEYAHEDHERQGDVDHNLGGLALLLAGASEELREVLRVVAAAPGELLELLLEPGDDEGWSRRLARLCRISNPSSGVVAELRQLLSEEP